MSIRVEPDTGVAVVTPTGVLGAKDAQQWVTALWSAPEWSGQSAVWDFRDAEFDVSSADVRRIAQFVLRNQPATPPARVAFVTGRDVDYGMARVFQVMREDPRTSFRVFREFDEAVRWARYGS